MHTHQNQPGFKTLQTLLAPIVRWAVRLGIGHGQFSRMLKPLFLEAAHQELSRQGVRHSDSALSFISGLHRGDVSAFLSGNPEEAVADEKHPVYRINPANQVIARWLIRGLPAELPLKGPDSFDQLVRETQSDRGAIWSTRLILQDLERRGLVADDARKVRLLSEVGLPDIDSEAGVSHFVGAIRDHIEACLANLVSEDGSRFLEQSLVVDGLYPKSVEALHNMSREWWRNALSDLGAKAIEHSEADEPQGGNHRLRLGIYFFSEKSIPPQAGL